MDAKKNNESLCNISIKNVPCEIKVYFTQQANKNDRTLSKEIISILKQVKSKSE